MLSQVKSTVQKHTDGNGKRNNHPLTKRQLGTIALVTFGITLFGLYYYNRYHKIMKKNKKNEKPKTGLNDHDVDRLFEAPVNDNIDKQTKKDEAKKDEAREDETNEINETNENNEEKDYTLEWKDIKDKILSIFEEFTENNIKKRDIKILIMDNKLSKLPIYLFNEGYHDITVCDMSNAVNQMKTEYGQQYSNIKWISCNEDDIKDNKLPQILSETYHLIIHKDVAEAFEGSEEQITMDSNELAYEKLKQFSKMLIEQVVKDEDNEESLIFGKYLLMSPRRKIPHLKDNELNWSTIRTIAIGFDVNAVQYAKTPFLYFHICTKLNRDNNKEILKQSREERQNAIQQNVYLANDIIITDVEVNKTDNKTVITVINTEDDKDNDKDKNVIDFSNKNKEVQTKSVLIRRLDMTFVPTIMVESIENDILMTYSKYESDHSVETGVLFHRVPYYFMVNGIIVSVRKFGRRIIFYDVKLNNKNNTNNSNSTEDEDSVTTIQCVAQKSYVNSLSNEKLNKEFKTNYTTQPNDEVILCGVLGLSDKRILSIFCQYILVQQ